jgi:hypothetical protein
VFYVQEEYYQKDIGCQVKLVTKAFLDGNAGLVVCWHFLGFWKAAVARILPNVPFVP